MFQWKFFTKFKRKIKLEANFFLFDANPNLSIKDFNYKKLAFSNEKGVKSFI